MVLFKVTLQNPNPHLEIALRTCARPLRPFQACGGPVVGVKCGIYSGKPTEYLIQGAPRPAAPPWADPPLVPPPFEPHFGLVGLPPTGAVGGRR